MSIFPPTRGYLRPLLVILLILICLGMARLQLWRAEPVASGSSASRRPLSRRRSVCRRRHREREKLLDRAATARGRWLPTKTLFLDNKIYRNRAGYQVLTPLQLSGSNVVVLVNRGWIVAPRLRSDVPSVRTTGGEIEISGVTRSFETRTFELQKAPPQGAVWQHVREADYRQISGLDALPVILLQTGTDDDGLIRDWDVPDNPAAKHYGYAAMWLVFALMAAAYGLFAWRKK